jgi:phosphatidylethanolamine N-methyltransferase
MRAILDIERMYGQKKPIAQRIPLMTNPARRSGSVSGSDRADSPAYSESLSRSATTTPSQTEGETATDTEFETETETEYEDQHVAVRRMPQQHKVVPSRPRSPPVSQHDLLNRYFRKDAIFLHNIDLLR